MKQLRQKIRNSTIYSMLGLLFLSIAFSSFQRVQAATLTTTYLRLSRMSTSQSGAARLVFKAATSGATSVTVNMNGADSTTWTGQSGAVAASPAPSSTACAAETAATALPGTLAGSGSGSTITISGITALNAGTTYCVDLTSTSALTNPSTAGEYHPVITAGGDSTTLAVRVVTNDSYTINAIVAPTFNFALSTNADSFTSSLTTGTVSITTGVTATINTNSKTGWLAWAKGTNNGLTSASASRTIAATTPGTNATLTAGSEGYVTGITNIAQGSGTGTATAIAAYDATGATHGSGLDTSYRQIATSTGTANNAVLTIKDRATISALTPAATDYTDTITIIGAGRF